MWRSETIFSLACGTILGLLLVNHQYQDFLLRHLVTERNGNESVDGVAPISALASSSKHQSDDDVFLLAYYYAWYREDEWDRHGTQGVSPLLGPYGSQRVEIAEKHNEWAMQAGIDAWVVSWWKEVPNSDFQQGMMKARNFQKMKYCLIWESMGALPTFDFANETALDAFVRDMTLMRDYHFGHPCYLHVNGRPVVVMYVTRVWNNFEPFMVDIVRDKVGVDIFFVGDEPFYGDDTQADPYKAKHGIKNGTQVFDAYTTYNMYSEPDTHEGQTAVDFMTTPKVMNVLQQWSNSTIFFPNVLPKYHDFRGKGHPLLGDTAGFRTQLDNVACLPRPTSFVKGSIPNMIFVTSWNEWWEGSQIEPDDGKNPRPYNFTFINELRDFKETGRRCS